MYPHEWDNSMLLPLLLLILISLFAGSVGIPFNLGILTIRDIKDHEFLKMVLTKTISEMWLLYMSLQILFPILPILCDIAQFV